MSAMTPHQAAEAFLTPPRSLGNPVPEFAQGTSLFIFNGPLGRMASRRIGRGPKVLLVHGWGGNASDMAAFVEPLVEAGNEVIIPDLPGHGESDGKMVSIANAAQGLLELQKHTGPFHAVVAHSVGTAAAVHAMRNGLKTNCAALISPPARYRDYASGFANQIGLNGEEALEMIEVLRQLGHDVAAVDSPASARNLWQPALVLHSSDDRVVPVADGREIAEAWPASRLVLLDGLGHRRILQAPEVVAQVLSFIAP